MVASDATSWMKQNRESLRFGPFDGATAATAPASDSCVAAMARDGCSPDDGVILCDACVGRHQSDLRAAKCTSTAVKAFCAGSVPQKSQHAAAPALSASCSSALAASACNVSSALTECNMCAAHHQHQLRTAGCSATEVEAWCSGGWATAPSAAAAQGGKGGQGGCVLKFELETPAMLLLRVGTARPS